MIEQGTTWRYVICRVLRSARDPNHGRLRPIADVREYVAACLFADVAHEMCGGEFLVWDSSEKKITPYRWKAAGPTRAAQAAR